MRAGELRHRVTLQKLVSGQDAYGGPNETWSDLATVWAAVEEPTGRETWAGKQVTAVASMRVRLRYRSDITSSMRLVWGARVLNIQAPPIDPDGKRRELWLLVNEVV